MIGISTGTRLPADWRASCYENVLGHRGWLTTGLAAQFGYYRARLAAVFFSCLQRARSVLGRVRVRPCVSREQQRAFFATLGALVRTGGALSAKFRDSTHRVLAV